MRKIIIIAIVTVLCFVFINRSKVVSIEPINLDESILYASEPPTMLYADEEKAIFLAYGIFVYDIENDTISRSLDIKKFGEKNIDEHRFDVWQYVLKNGEEILIVYRSEHGDILKTFSYSLISKEVVELSVEEFTEKKENVFECEEHWFADEKGKWMKLTANINDNEYAYIELDFDGSGYIEVVYVEGNQSTVYHAVSLEKTLELYKKYE